MIYQKVLCGKAYCSKNIILEYMLFYRGRLRRVFFFFFNKHLSFFRQFDPHELFWFCCFITITLALRFLNDKPPKVMFLVHLLVVHLLRAILPVGEIYALFTKCVFSKLKLRAAVAARQKKIENIRYVKFWYYLWMFVTRFLVTFVKTLPYSFDATL